MEPIDPQTQASRDFAVEIAQLAHDRHCTDIVILELVDRSPIARHFIVATGTSSQQIKSVAQEISKLGKDNGNPPFANAGIQQGRWAIVDFVDVVVHIFDNEYRNFYDLEMLWGDAPRVEWVPENPPANDGYH